MEEYSQDDISGKRTTLPYQLPDYQSALALSETREIIDTFFIDYCGLEKHEMNNGQYEFRRIAKPKFTYDYANKLITDIYILSNRITSRTKFIDTQINRWVLSELVGLMMDMAITGFDNLISEKIWNHAIELLELTDKTKEVLLEDGTKLNIRMNRWEVEAHINWAYDSPFMTKHLSYIKKKFNIEQESFSQDSILASTFYPIAIFIHGSINRSWDALTLDHEKVVHKEIVESTQATSTKPNENILEKLKNATQGGVRR